MKLNVSSKNEHKFVPNLGNNLELPEDQQFVIIYKKINKFLHGQEWTIYKKDNTVDRVDYPKLMKMHIVRLVNPPILHDTETDKEEELTILTLVSDKYDILFQVQEDFVNTVLGIGDEDELKK